MTVKFEDRDYTIGELYRPAMNIETQSEADEYFKALVEHSVSRYHRTVEEATRIQKSNLGYFAGYYDPETSRRVHRLFDCQHPIFGKDIPSAEEAFDMGKIWAKEL